MSSDASSSASRFWLLKSEPSDYSISAMEAEGRTVWDGVRNMQARKFMREMRLGDRCLFYHSSCKNVGVVGEVKVVREAYPDPADANWSVVDVAHVETWPSIVSLDTLKTHKDGALQGMKLLQQPRLSVQPVSAEHCAFVQSLRDAEEGSSTEEPPRKRPRAAASAAASALNGFDTTVAYCRNLHSSQEIVLTSEDALEPSVFKGVKTMVVTLHTNARPKKLPKGTIHIGAAFDDTSTFDDAELTMHLAKMAANVKAAATPRVVFVCQVGVNRSSLALCYYVATYGRCSWQEAKASIIAAKGGAAAGWPTLANAAFEAYLGRRFDALLME